MVNKHIQVLLIEDDPMVQEVNKQFIERVDGFKVIDTARNGVEGLAKIEKLQPDLVMLDIFMPQQDGIETLYQIRIKKLPVDVIVITAADDSETIHAMLQNGAIDYIIKPFKYERICQSLKHYESYRRHFMLEDEGILTQKQLDQILLSVPQERETKIQLDIPKGLNEITLKQVVLFLLKQTAAKSADEVSEGIGVARVTARRYLEYLGQEGRVRIEIEYGSVGRPINRYRMNV